MYYSLFIFLIESTWDPDMKIIKKFSISNFLHRGLAVQKREISLPDGSQTAQSGDLGIVEPWRQNKNANF